MDKYDELLVRLDNLIRTHEGKLIDCHDAAAAIRELEAKLEAAEQRLREVEAATIERCARTAETYNWIDDIRVQSPDEHQSAIVFAIRALAPERTVAGQADLGSSSEPLAAKATLLDTHERSEFNREDDASSVASCRDEPASPLLPGLERAAEICQGVHSACLAINRGTTSADPDHERFQYQANGADECGYTIRAEISCLKGEGRGSL